MVLLIRLMLNALLKDMPYDSLELIMSSPCIVVPLPLLTMRKTLLFSFFALTFTMAPVTDLMVSLLVTKIFSVYIPSAMSIVSPMSVSGPSIASCILEKLSIVRLL